VTGHFTTKGSVSAPGTYAELSPKGKAAVDKAMVDAGVTNESLDAEVLRCLTPESLAAGAKEYPACHEFNARIAQENGATLEEATACTAALSPRNVWVQNQRASERIMAHRDDKISTEQLGREQSGGMAAPGIKAAKLARGEVSPEEGLGSNAPKIRSFYNNMMFPGETNSVTVDMFLARLSNRASTLPKVRADELVINNPSATKFLSAAKASTGGGAGHVVIGDSIRRVAASTGAPLDSVRNAVWLVMKGDVTI